MRLYSSKESPVTSLEIDLDIEKRFEIARQLR